MGFLLYPARMRQAGIEPFGFLTTAVLNFSGKDTEKLEFKRDWSKIP